MTMKNYFSKLGLLLILGLATVVFSSCEDRNKPNNPPNNGDYVLSSITKEIGDDWETNINGTVTDSIITLSSVGGLTMPKVGDILIKSQITEKFPYGFLGKVIEVKQEGGGAKIVTESVPLEEAFEELNLHFSQNISEYAISEYVKKGAPFANTRATADNNEVFLELPLEILDSDNIQAEGTLKVALSFDFDIKIKRLKMTYLNAAVNPKFELSADFSISVSSENKIEVELASIPFAAIPIGPLVIVPKVQLFAVIGADGTIELQTGISYSQSARYGVKYENGAFNPYMESTTDKPFEAEAIFSIGGKLYMGTHLTLLCGLFGTDTGIGVGVTPEMAATANFEMNVNEFENGGFYGACKQSKLKAGIYLNGDIFVNAKIFSKTIAQYSLYTPDFEICTLFEKYLLPHFSDFTITDKTETSATVAYTVPNDILFPANIGLILYDNFNQEVTRQYHAQTHYNIANTIYKFTFTGLEAGKTYYVLPVIKFSILPDIKAAPSFSLEDCENFDNPQGVVINGVRWATRNIGAPGTFASSPCDPGMFYQWNRKVGYPSTDEYVTGCDSSIPTGTNWEKANDPCPADWRVPTKSELDGLVSSGSSWTNTPVNGRIFGSGANTIFLPAAGWRDPDDGTLYYVGSDGGYWSSTYYEALAYFLGFGSGYVYTIIFNYRHGYSVRCVAE